MTPEQLKASILKAAFDGKLVEQIKQDKTVEDELKELGIIESKISDEEKDDRVIPETWKLIKLKDLVSISTGKKDANYGSPDGMYDFFTCSAEPIKSKDYSYDGEYLIMPGNGANIGMVIYYRGKFEAYQRTYLLENIHSIDMKYLKYHLESNWKAYNADKMFGSAIPYIKLGNLQNYIVSFPPIEEQHQIVAKIEEILPLIEKYAEAYEKLEKFNAKFPEDMKKSILQYAIQGKLVEQRPEEGTAEELYQQIQEEKQKLIQEGKIKKEKPLDDILEDDIPFDIPESWTWCRFQELCSVLTCGYASTPTYVSEDVGMPFISAKNVKPYRFMPDDHKFIGNDLYEQLTATTKPEKGDILLTRVGAGIGEAAIIDVDMDFAIYVSLTLIKLVNNSLICNRYILHWLNSPLGTVTAQKNIFGKGASQGNLNVKNVREFIVPLPPYEEQIRIADKIDELLPYCDQLIK